MGVKKILDVGGGGGKTAIKIAEKYSNVKIDILDLSTPKKLIKKHIENKKLNNRISYIESDFFIFAWHIQQLLSS